MTDGFLICIVFQDPPPGVNIGFEEYFVQSAEAFDERTKKKQNIMKNIDKNLYLYLSTTYSI